MTDFKRRHLVMLAELNKSADECARKAVREWKWRRFWLCYNAAWAMWCVLSPFTHSYTWAFLFVALGAFWYWMSIHWERMHWRHREELLQLRAQLEKALGPYIDQLEELDE